MLKKSLLIATVTSIMYAGTHEKDNYIEKSTHKPITNKTVLQKEIKHEKYQILSKKIDSTDNIVTASGDVLIISKTYYMTAQKVIYDKDKETFELFGEVVVLKDNLLQTISDYTLIDMKNDNFKQHPTLILNKKSLLWINSSKSNKKKNIVSLKNSILSSCNCEDPDWSIQFSSGAYDVKDQWIETFNNRLYIGSTPVLYLPYFAFPADDTRRTGILIPTLGQSSSDGFIYEQPIYFAPEDNYDVELVPQFRTKRGVGLYTYFRYVDTIDSILNISTGVFKEKASYFNNHTLENQTHTGFEVEYQKRNFFYKDLDKKDGLFVDLDWASDVEYKNIGKDVLDQSYAKKIESRVNYFLNTPNYYTGLYFTYYLDTSVKSNNNTMQKVPQVQLHTYSKPLIFDDLIYSTDTVYTNYTRPEGINADIIDLSLPISYSFSIWNDYVNITLKNETTTSFLQYSNSQDSFENGTFVENKSTISTGTDLLKSYDNYIHTLNFNVDFTLPTVIVDRGDLYKITNNSSELDSFLLKKTSKTLAFLLNHSFYDKNELSQIVNHKIKQSILYDNNNARLSDFENEITFNYILGRLTNRIVYSQEDNTMIESSSGFSLKYYDYFLNSTHYKSKKTENSDKKDLESYTIEMGMEYLNDYSLSYIQNYNIKEHLKSKEALSFNINDKCWIFNIRLEKEIIASDSNNNDPIKQDLIYFTLELKQLGGINLKN